ncbi:MAG: zf-HC2 domain-containing protein [bacterium]|nr:zf-HC2 domain-containing protein [bacterium]
MSNHEFIACVNPTIGAKLLSYGLGNLPEEEKNEFEEHLLLCPACQSELKAAGQMLKAMSVGKGELARKLQGEPEPKESPGITPRVYLWPIVAAAACLIGLIYWAAQPSRDNRPISSVQVLADTHDIATDRLDTATLVRVDSMKVDSVSQSKRFAALATKTPVGLHYAEPSRSGCQQSRKLRTGDAGLSRQELSCRRRTVAQAGSRAIQSTQSSYSIGSFGLHDRGNTSEAIRLRPHGEVEAPHNPTRPNTLVSC